MVKADTRALNLLLPKDLSEWFTDYAKSQNKTKTEIICSLLQGIKNDDAYSDVANPVDNSVDGIESIVKAYLDRHLHSFVDNVLQSSKQADVVNPVDDSLEADELPIIKATAAIADVDSAATDIDISKGMKINEAFELAKSRGYNASSKNLNDKFDKSEYGAKYGLSRIAFKNGKERWLYFDTQTLT